MAKDFKGRMDVFPLLCDIPISHFMHPFMHLFMRLFYDSHSILLTCCRIILCRLFDVRHTHCLRFGDRWARRGLAVLVSLAGRAALDRWATRLGQRRTGELLVGHRSRTC